MGKLVGADIRALAETAPREELPLTGALVSQECRAPDQWRENSFHTMKAFMRERGQHGFSQGRAVLVLWIASASGRFIRACSRSFPLPASKLASTKSAAR